MLRSHGLHLTIDKPQVQHADCISSAHRLDLHKHSIDLGCRFSHIHKYPSGTKYVDGLKPIKGYAPCRRPQRSPYCQDLSWGESAVVLQLAFFFRLLLSLSCLLLLVVARFLLVPPAPAFGTSKRRFQIHHKTSSQAPKRFSARFGLGMLLVPWEIRLWTLAKSNPSEG